MSDKKIKIAIIGCGAIASFHCQALDAFDNAEVIGVYDTSLERAKAFADIREFAVDDVLYRVSTKIPKAKMDTEEFWSTYKQKGYNGLFKKYCKASLKTRISFEIQKNKRKNNEK